MNFSCSVSGELLDEAQFEVGDGEEAEDHDDQSQVVLPQTPGGVIDALLLQVGFPRAPGRKNRRLWSEREPGSGPRGSIYIFCKKLFSNSRK